MTPKVGGAAAVLVSEAGQPWVGGVAVTPERGGDPPRSQWLPRRGSVRTLAPVFPLTCRGEKRGAVERPLEGSGKAGEEEGVGGREGAG